jgi:hypothetical protein
LRRRLAQRQQEKAELERQLHAAQARYRGEVAPLKEEVLRLQMERLRRAAQRHMRSAKHRNAYHDAQRAYESFQEERSQPDAPAPDALKRRYRQASKRCHPDMVSPAHRAQAAATFQALESAYQAGHAEAVQAIATALDRWGFPKEGRDDCAGKGREIDDLQDAVSSLGTAIEALQNTDVYRAVAEAEDVEALLEARKRELLYRLRRLKQEGGRSSQRR